MGLTDRLLAGLLKSSRKRMLIGPLLQRKDGTAPNCEARREDARGSGVQQGNEDL